MRKIIAVVVIATLLSCDGKAVYKKFDENFASNQWKKSDIKTYDFDIEKEGNYDIVIDFSHVYDIQFAALPMTIEILNPDQTTSKENFNLELRDSDGREVGDCSGDYCDMEQVVFQNRKFSAGKHIITLSHRFDFDYFPNVLGVGIRVVPSKN